MELTGTVNEVEAFDTPNQVNGRSGACVTWYIASHPASASQTTSEHDMGLWQNTLVKLGAAQPGPKITPHDRAVLE